jgi:hypothetical protein
LLVALLDLLGGGQLGADAFALSSVEHRPNFTTNTSDPTGRSTMAVPPTDLRLHQLDSDGWDVEKDSSIAMSRFTHAGCFRAPVSITAPGGVNTPGIRWDPNECIAHCKSIYNETLSYHLVVAVYAERCGCTFRHVMADYQEVGPDQCTEFCKNYRNPICGGAAGADTFWGFFMEYDLQSLGAQGAYDPWRYLWYTVAVFRDTSLSGRFAPPELEPPERYYLHAIDTVTGEAQFQFQMRIADGIFYGLQYDIDSSRIAALFTPINTGRSATTFFGSITSLPLRSTPTLALSRAQTCF